MPKPFIDSGLYECRFPVSGVGMNMMICGAPIVEGHSYCPACCAIAYREPEKTRRLPSAPRESIPAAAADADGPEEVFFEQDA